MKRWRKVNAMQFSSGPFAMIPRDIFLSNISGNAIKILGVLLTDANKEHHGDYSVLTMREISYKARLSINTVQDCLDELLKFDIIRRKPIGKSFIYEFTAPLCRGV